MTAAPRPIFIANGFITNSAAAAAIAGAPPKPERRSRVELCGMRGGLPLPDDYPVRVPGGTQSSPDVVRIEFVDPPEVSNRCSHCTTQIECDWLGVCARAERIEIEGLVR